MVTQSHTDADGGFPIIMQWGPA